jgi:hypothetical protein
MQVPWSSGERHVFWKVPRIGEKHNPGERSRNLGTIDGGG